MEVLTSAVCPNDVVSFHTEAIKRAFLSQHQVTDKKCLAPFEKVQKRKKTYGSLSIAFYWENKLAWLQQVEEFTRERLLDQVLRNS